MGQFYNQQQKVIPPEGREATKGKFHEAVMAGRSGATGTPTPTTPPAERKATENALYNQVLSQEIAAKPIPKTPFKSPVGAQTTGRPSQNYAAATQHELSSEAAKAAQSKAEQADKEKLAHAKQVSQIGREEAKQAETPEGLKSLQEKYRSWMPEPSYANLVQSAAVERRSKPIEGDSKRKVEELHARAKEGLPSRESAGVKLPREVGELSNRQRERNLSQELRGSTVPAYTKKDDHEDDPEKREEESEETVPELVKKAKNALILAKSYMIHTKSSAPPTGSGGPHSPDGGTNHG